MQNPSMNWEQVEGKWDQVRGRIRTQWGKLTDDDLEKSEGRRERIVGKIRERYGAAKEEVENKLDALIDRL